MTSTTSEQPVQTRGGSYEEGLQNGQKLLEQHPAVALQQAETLLRGGPEPLAFQLAAAALRELGRPADAEQAELDAIKASLAIPELDAAAVANHEGRKPQSRAMLERFLATQPDNLLAMTMIAELDIDAWVLERAEARLRAVIERAPTFLRGLMLLAKCLSCEARLQEAIDIFSEVLKRKPNNVVVLQNLAQAHAEANQHEKTVEFYGRLLELDPTKQDISTIYAQELRILGRKEEAKAAFRRAIALDPSSGAGWWGLANFFPSEITGADVDAIKRALANDDGSFFDGAPLNVALGVLAERRGDYEEAFRYISEGKKIRSQSSPYDRASFSARVDELIATFAPERFEMLSGAGSPDNSPIFIVGMPRAGTTLLERILSGHSQIEAGGELPIIPRLDERFRHEGGGSSAKPIASLSAQRMGELGEWYIDRSRDYRLTDKPRFIDKMNMNWFRLGLIRLVLPNARIIDLRRNALDCCWSNFKMMFAEGHVAGNDQRDIGSYFRDYVRMVDAIDAAAPGGIIRVRYEELVDDVEGQTRRILDFLSLEYEPECIDFHLSTAAVATPSSEQVRRPINRDSIGSAEPYRQWLGPMIEELGPLADA